VSIRRAMRTASPTRTPQANKSRINDSIPDGGAEAGRQR
jgi:hypothetical protein